MSRATRRDEGLLSFGIVPWPIITPEPVAAGMLLRLAEVFTVAIQLIRHILGNCQTGVRRILVPQHMSSFPGHGLLPARTPLAGRLHLDRFCAARGSEQLHDTEARMHCCRVEELAKHQKQTSLMLWHARRKRCPVKSRKDSPSLSAWGLASSLSLTSFLSLRSHLAASPSPSRKRRRGKDAALRDLQAPEYRYQPRKPRFWNHATGCPGTRSRRAG